MLKKIITGTIKGRDKITNDDKIITMRFSFGECNEEFTLAVLCDGMGGLARAKESSEVAANTFALELITSLTKGFDFSEKDFSLLNYRDRIKSSVINALNKANDAVCELSVSGVSNGTTLSAVLLADDYLIAVNIGDSPILFFSEDNCFYRTISVSDNVVNTEDEVEKVRLNSFLGKYSKLTEDMYHIFVSEKIERKKVSGVMILSDGASDEFLKKYLYDSEELYYYIGNFENLFAEKSVDDASMIFFEV